MKLKELTQIEIIVLWGAGKEFAKKYNKQFEFDLLVDSSEEKIGKMILGHIVQSPEYISRIRTHAIVVVASRKYYSEIKRIAKQRYSLECVYIDDYIRVLNWGWSSNRFELLSKAGTTIESLGCIFPCDEAIDLVKRLKERGNKLCVAEIGVGFGVTAVEICKCLDFEDEYWFFDFYDVAEALEHDLNLISDISCKIEMRGNSNVIFDSYNWALSELVLKRSENDKNGKFDLAYLDGAHTFPIDGLTTCILKLLIKRGGYIVFDDLHWAMNDSSNSNSADHPENLTLYTNDMMDECQMERVIDLFMRNDCEWEEIVEEGFDLGRAVFRKR